MPAVSAFNLTAPDAGVPTHAIGYIQHNEGAIAIGSIVLGGIGVLLAVATLVIAYLQLRYHMRISGESSDVPGSIVVMCIADMWGKLNTC